METTADISAMPSLYALSSWKSTEVVDCKIYRDAIHNAVV